MWIRFHVRSNRVLFQRNRKPNQEKKSKRGNFEYIVRSWEVPRPLRKGNDHIVSRMGKLVSKLSQEKGSFIFKSCERNKKSWKPSDPLAFIILSSYITSPIQPTPYTTSQKSTLVVSCSLAFLVGGINPVISCL